jgi:cell division protein FtsQ
VGAAVIASGPRRLLARISLKRLAIAVVAAVVVLGGGWLWFRDSSLVAVKRVTVTGLSGPDVGAIRSSLVNEALTMSTLDYDARKLQNAVSGYPFIHSLSVSTSFPHAMTIAVNERIPIATVDVAHRAVPIDAAGLLLYGTAVHGQLPVVPLRFEPGGATVTATGAKAALAVLGAAPFQLIGHIASATWSDARGVIVQMRGGPQIYFGAPAQLRRKWGSAITVLADPASAGAAYIDVSNPVHPAAGVGTRSTTGTSTTAVTTTSPAGATGAGTANTGASGNT